MIWVYLPCQLLKIQRLASRSRTPKFFSQIPKFVLIKFLVIAFSIIFFILTIVLLELLPFSFLNFNFLTFFIQQLRLKVVVGAITILYLTFFTYNCPCEHAQGVGFFFFIEINAGFEPQTMDLIEGASTIELTAQTPCGVAFIYEAMGVGNLVKF